MLLLLFLENKAFSEAANTVLADPETPFISL